MCKINKKLGYHTGNAQRLMSAGILLHNYMELKVRGKA